ncbi:histidine kinase [Erythrobacter sp. SG61-1L]|uniref:sensor histidine kinase n=1 Tax=Erythrobacter sp. SG61-1L TaxID=1603897 RepID=UPI0006C8E714|nr:histidine kinase [Erythrobacter sp. SG61-1L]KPL69140.1 histidine kinase [Erythrobacter sp. SG61-1L]
MAVLPSQPTPFFANKNRAFWQIQFAGWGGIFLFRSVSALANTQPLNFLVIILIAAITGFSISLLLSVIYRQLINRRPVITWTFSPLALGIAVCLYCFIDAWVISLYRPTSEASFAQLFLGVFYIDMTLLGAWSALYYAINYFLQAEEKADELAQMQLQATTAQLAMLRYQLNPHFLFNTLNSISTLVLLKQTEPANAMLTRLSAFLRHTLVNEPGGKVTVEEEVETLKLYLDIERMRFEERLRTEFRIDDSARRALLPSLLLQPLVENAIKYAVSPQEEGAKISISARLIGQRLRITVADTGPGLQNTRTGTNFASVGASGAGMVSSTGVGLTNIRDRLAQAYGDDHVFETRTPAQGGFTVVIEIPYEAAEQEETPTLPKLQSKPAMAGNAAQSQALAKGQQPVQRELGLGA